MEEERNKTPEKVKIYKIGVEDKIDTYEHDNILEILRKCWSWNEWRLKDSLMNL